MIIVCPECSTKFNISSDRIPEGGARVRCARCKYVFRVERPFEPEQPSQPEELEDSAGQSIDDPDFSYDKFQELDTKTADSETFTFGKEPETESENFTFAEPAEEPNSPIEKDLAEKSEETGSSDAVAEQESIDEPAPVVETPAAAPSHSIEKKKGGAVSSIIKVLFLLILGILIVGGVFVYINGPDQLNQTIQQIFGQQTNRPVQTGQITLSNLEGKFIQNEHNGDLFLIHGEAINNFNQPRAAIQVKGVIFDQSGKPLLQKTVFCGNPITLQELKTLSFVELEKIMGNQFGKDLRNMKIESKASIPFDIVFKDLPQNLSEFSVKVTSSEAATK